MTSYFVDPGSGNDTTGDGSIGTPWATVQHALDTITPSAPDQINVKSGTDDVLSAALDFSTYNPGFNSPVIIRGYASSENDGGQGSISGGGSVAIVNSSTLDHVSFIDMKVHNCGSANIVTLRNSCLLSNCEITNTSGSGLSLNESVVEECNVHDVGNIGIQVSRGFIKNSYLKNGTTNKFQRAVVLVGGIINRCEISIDGASNGIQLNTSSLLKGAINNSILSSSGTGYGIGISDTGSRWGSYIENNIIEGFSGAGGVDLFLPASSNRLIASISNNSSFNCTTINAGNSILGTILNENNETLASTGFSKSGSDTFVNRKTYFSPNDVGSIYGGSHESGTDRGSVQHTAIGGGRRPRMRVIT